MSKVSKIQWTDATYNPWHGCTKVSPGCRYCYMYRDKDRYGVDPTTVVRSKTNFDAPMKWKEGNLIFTCSWSDFFISEADIWRMKAWEVIRKTPQHIYQILTKRPERIKKNLPEWFDEISGHVWIGVSVENQDYVDRIKFLNDLPCVRFASFEPLLGKIEWDDSMSQLDWIIIGGESGNDTGKWQYRPMEISWAEKLVEEAKSHNIPVFVKQLGTYQAKQLKLNDRHGGDLKEFPPHLQIREYPIPVSAGHTNVM
jgi:protein gp37